MASHLKLSSLLKEIKVLNPTKLNLNIPDYHDNLFTEDSLYKGILENINVPVWVESVYESDEKVMIYLPPRYYSEPYGKDWNLHSTEEEYNRDVAKLTDFAKKHNINIHETTLIVLAINVRINNKPIK